MNIKYYLPNIEVPIQGNVLHFVLPPRGTKMRIMHEIYLVRDFQFDMIKINGMLSVDFIEIFLDTI